MTVMRRGFLLADAVMGLSLVVLLIGTLTFAAVQQKRMAQRMQAERALVHQAEAVLIRAQQGATRAIAHDARDTVRMEVLDDAAAPAGQRWVKVTARDGTRHASLIGLVPDRAAATSSVNREGK